MFHLAPDTEALVRRLAEVRHLSIDEAVRQAVAEALSTPPIEPEVQDLAVRRLALLDEFARRVTTLPPRDPRSSREITDDLNPL